MPKLSFNADWTVYPLHEENPAKLKVDVPYDAMLREERSPEAEGGVNTCWILAKDYAYEKEFEKPEIPEGGKALLEFGGVYRNAEIYLNEQLIFQNAYGYNTFFVDLTDRLKEGKNLLKVIAHNADQPNSRWYTGTGIYRPVYLHILPKERIEFRTLRVKTVDYKTGTVEAFGNLTSDGEVKIEVFNQENTLVAAGKSQSQNKAFSLQLSINAPSLWNAEHPYLYQLKATFLGYEETRRFGIRQLEWGQDGFLVNGERTLLKGACIHHDNGPLGGESYRDAEYRKARLLKEVGYNAIRSAHNPLCEDMLDACDELGIYVMDEYADCWYIHKTKYDYVNELMANWKEDLRLMVEKDYNHPSVVLYSIGNEVAETSETKGIALIKEFVDHLKALDPSRMTTCGVNIFFNALYSWGFGVYSDKKADSNQQAKAKKQEVGSAFFNKIANFVGSNVMKVGSTIHRCDVKTRGAFALLDAPGYNYAIFRYKHDLKKYPNRIIVGSETFCSDANWWMQFAKDNPRMIGDFVWAGMDYLGECGVGSWVSQDDAPSFDHGMGWMTAGSGRLDITGRFLGEALYTQVMYGLKPIELAVVAPREKEVKHAPSAWKFSMALPCFDFPGQEGKKATAEIYSTAEKVALFLNGKKVAQSKTKKNGNTPIKFAYQPGELKAVSFDKAGKKIAEVSLYSGTPGDHLTLHPETEHPLQNNNFLYVRLALGDENGNIRPYLKDMLEIDNVKGGKLLRFANGNPYNAEGYLTNKSLTYQGEALAIFEVEDEKAFDFTAKSKYGEASFREAK